MSIYFPEPSDDIKQVIYEIQHPREEVWDIIKGHKEGEDYIEFLKRRFNEWINELLKLIDEEHQNWKYLVDFLNNLLSLLGSFNLEQLGLFLHRWFPDGKEINFQTLKDLDFAIATMSDGFRKLFAQVVQEVGSEYKNLNAFPQVSSKTLRNYAEWALPRYYSIGKFMPGYIDAWANEHYEKAMNEYQDAKNKKDELDNENDPIKQKELEEKTNKHLIAWKLFGFNSQLLNKVKSRLNAEINFIKTYKSFFEFNQIESIKTELPRALCIKREKLLNQLFQSKEYLSLFTQGKIEPSSDTNELLKSVGKYFPEEVRKINNLLDSIKAFEEDRLTQDEIFNLASEIGIKVERSSFQDQVRSILGKWLDYMNKLKGAPIQDLEQPDFRIANLIDKLPNMNLEELSDLAKKFDIPLPNRD